MNTLDRYVVRNFLYSYLLCFLVMIGLRVTADLFINMDEFAELNLAWAERMSHVGSYYLCNSLVYFRELAGVILVAGAGFSLARMNHTNELTAILASGVSLHRVLLPIALVAVALSMLSVVNQELLIPRVKHSLVRDRDDVPGTESFEVRPITDGRHNVWYSWRFEAGRMVYPLILARDGKRVWTGTISGLEATYTGEGTWCVRDAVAASPGRAYKTSVIRTWQSPEILRRAARAGGLVGSRNRPVGLRITAKAILPDRGILIQPCFEILARPARPSELADAPVLATIRATAACYEKLPDAAKDEGYVLIGPPELRRRDIRNWRQFCRKLNADRSGDKENHPGKRIWNLLPGALRYAIGASIKAQDKLLAEGKKLKRDKPSPTDLSDVDKAEMIKALNAIIKKRTFFQHADASTPSDFRNKTLPRLDRVLLGRGRDTLTGQQVARLNRLVLDLYYGDAIVPSQGELFVATDLTPKELALRRDSRWMEYLATKEINALLGGGKISDPTRAALIKHSRFTEPLADLLLLLVGIPFILSRERNIKASAFRAVAVVGMAKLTMFMCRYLSDYGISPVLAVWLPILVIGPIAVLMLDAVKT